MLHFLLNLCAFCRLASRLAWYRHPCPAPAPAPARTAPARPADTARERHALPHAAGAHDTPSTPARWTRRRPPPLCRQPARPDRTDRASRRTRGHPERKRGRARRETGRNSEDLRPLACRIAAQVIKASNPARSQPDRSQRRRPAGTPPATVPSSSPSPCLPAVNSAFGEFAEPRPVFARQQTHNGTPPACLDATGTGGAFTFSRPLRFSRNGSVPPLYHVRPISPFFTREQSRRFPNSK